MTTTSSVSLDGIDLHVTLAGEGPPLLLLHGFFGSSADWVHLFDTDALARSYQLVMPDLRGHGRSTNPGGAFTHRQCAEDLFALLDHLGIGRFKAVGVSCGGNVLLHMATRQPDRLEAMVTVGAPSYFPEQARRIMRTISEDGHTEAEWQVLRARHVQGDDQIRALWRLARGFADSHHDMAFTPPLLATIAARTLIVTGDRDPLYRVEIFVEQYRAIPNASLLVLPQGGHDAVYTKGKAAFLDAALPFLRG